MRLSTAGSNTFKLIPQKKPKRTRISQMRIPAKSDSRSGPTPDTRSGRCRTVGAKRRWVEPYLVGFLSAVKLDRVFRMDSPASLMR